MHVRLKGPLAELLVIVDPKLYMSYVTYENGKKGTYLALSKALYGTLQAKLLFSEDLTGFLTKDLGFTIN